MQKVVQRSLLDFLQSRVGLFLIVCGAFWCLNTAIGLLHVLVTTSTSPLCPHCAQHDYSDTLGSGANPAQLHSLVYPTGLQSYEHTLCYEPIDVVYTWVNGSDPKLIADLAYWKARYADGDETTAMAAAQLAYNATANGTGKGESEDQAGANRFRDNQELRYSLRSIWKYAPWVRHVWIVTNGHVPYWLNLAHPRVTLVSHGDIFPNASHLPTFSSPAIETHLHRIPGIASKFIYFNDDVMLGNHITPDDFVTHGGGQKIFLSWNVPNCAPGCPDTWLADKYCDTACNNKECEWDMGDCVNNTQSTGGGSGGGGRDARYGNWESSRGGSSGSKYCAAGCPNNWVGDKVCDRSCKNAECAFDGGDCGLELIKTHLVSVDLPPTQTAMQYVRLENDTLVVPSGNDFLLPFGTAALYVNLSTAFPGATSIVDASHDNPTLIRSAIVTQNLKVLTLILFDEVDIEENSAEEEVALAAAAAGSNVTAGIEASTAQLGGTRRVEIFLQGELNGVVTNRTFHLTRPRFPSAEELAAAAEEAAKAEASSTGVDGRIVEDPDAMFAAAAAAETARASTESDQGAIHAASTEGVAATNANGQLNQAAATADDALREAQHADAASARDHGEPIPLSAGIGAHGDEEDEQNPTLVSRRRRLLSAFDTLVGTLRSYGRGDKSPSGKSPTDKPIDPTAPYQPPAGYSSHTRAYTSSPSAAAPKEHRGVGPSSYSSERFTSGEPKGFFHESWRDLPVFIDSVPISSDIAHSGVKLREGLDETQHTQPGENLWARANREETIPQGAGGGHHADGTPLNALHDSTGRIIEAYGWSAADHELASQIVQHKQKQLWLSAREEARTNFMEAWRRSIREKRKAEAGRWESFVHAGGHAGAAFDDLHDTSFVDSAATPRAPSPGAPRPKSSRFHRDPVWPWELSAAAPDLFEEWDWAAEAARFGRNEERLERIRARVRQREMERAGGKKPFDGFEFEVGSADSSAAASFSGSSAAAAKSPLDEEELEDDLELDLSLFGLPPAPVEASSTAASMAKSQSTSASTSPLSSSSTASSSSSSSSSSSTGSSDELVGSPRSLIDLSLPPGSGPRRTLLGEYGDSLRWVNRLYTKEFGKETRKAPAHMPHMIDVTIESELQGRWPQLFDDTSSHRFRHSHDMQYSFSYFYYLMNVPRAFDFHTVWREQLDLNGDGVLDQLEIRYLTLWLSGKKILPRDLTKMHEKLLNATRLVHGYAHEHFDPTDPPRIDMAVVSRATEVLELIEDKWSSLRQYKFELVNLDQIEFYMVPDNTTKVQLRLDEIRAKMPKFICLNDDMNKTADPPAETLQALRDFYVSYFPVPSPFELPTGQVNQFAYIDEWRAAKKVGAMAKMVQQLGAWWRGEDKKPVAARGAVAPPAGRAAAAAAAPASASSATSLSDLAFLVFWLLAALSLLLLANSQFHLLPRLQRALRSTKKHERTS